MSTTKEKPSTKTPKRKPTVSSRRSDYVVVKAGAEIKITEVKVSENLHHQPVRVPMRDLVKPVETRVSHLLTGKTFKPIRLIEKVRAGLPVMSIERVMDGLGIESAEALLPFIGMSSRTYARRKQSNQDLTPVESDRLYRLAKIESLAESVLGDKETANDWLKSPNRALGAAPLTLLDTEAGAAQVEAILTRIEYGVYS
jgi:putative toxin-antitoxin system antitoxin component (TIGR02293 family)